MSQKAHTLQSLQHDEAASMKPKWGSRIPELDGLRAIAIWMVLLLHVTSGYPKRPGALGFLPEPVLLVLGHGWLGVDLFFLLSGFLITGILLDAKNRPSYFKNFYVRRFLRIMPLYFTVVMVWVFAYHRYGRYFWLSSVFGANIAPLFHVPIPHGPDVLWSLAIEEHFYLLWPAVVLLLDRRKTLQICAAIFIVSPILRGIFAAKGMNPEVIYVLSWFRFDGLAMGAPWPFGHGPNTTRRPLAAYLRPYSWLHCVGSAWEGLGLDSLERRRRLPLPCDIPKLIWALARVSF